MDHPGTPTQIVQRLAYSLVRITTGEERLGDPAGREEEAGITTRWRVVD